MKGPKIVLIGAGSMFFGRQFVWSMTHSAALSGSTISLVDTDAAVLDNMMKLARAAIDHTGADIKLEGALNHKDVLKGADFIILSFAYKGIYFRGNDCKISDKYGVRMCSGDTIGPGGIFRTMRELPVILDIAADIEKICPDAWVINYINPVAVNGLGLIRKTKLKTFSMCDTHKMPDMKEQYFRFARIENGDINKFDMTIAGVNHFNWLLEAKYEGKDVMDRIAQRIGEHSAEEEERNNGKYHFAYQYNLWKVFGKLPTNISHTCEYVPYWQGKSVLPEKPATLNLFDAELRQVEKDKMWEEIAGYTSGEVEMSVFDGKYKSDPAVDVIEAMWTGNGKQYYVNTLNSGAVENLPDDAFLELLCDMSMSGPKPTHVGKFPLGLRGLQMQVLDTHELTVEAVVRRDRELLLRAFMTDPIVNSIPDAEAIIKELFETEKEALPSEWYV